MTPSASEGAKASPHTSRCCAGAGVLSCGAVLVAILFAGTLPRAPATSFGDGLLFWLQLAPQLFGTPLNTHPNRLRKEETYREGLSALPTDIDAVSNTDWIKQLRETMARTGEPAVVRGAQLEESRFGNLTELTVPKLKEIFGQTRVAVFTHMTNDVSAVDMPFSEYTERMGDPSELLYARAMPDFNDIWTKRMDLEWIASEVLGLPWSYAFTKLTAGGDMQGRLPLAFVGGKHVWTQAHCDVGTSIFLMVQGRKRWVLYPPTQSQYMYPYGQFRNVAYNAGLDVFSPNASSAPLFSKARGYEVTLHAGDVLIFPSFWWHGVQNLDDETVGIDVPVIDILGSWRRNSPLTLHSLLNPYMIRDVIKTLSNGGSMRGVFFAGYRKDGRKEGE